MRSVWSGNLAFGLVSIPVKLGSAVSSHKIGFRQIHLTDSGRVRYQKTCELDGQVLSTSDIGRAFETPDQLVEVTDAELQSLPLPTAKTIEVSGFLELSSVDTMQFDAPYFLAPASPAANKPYVLMRDALARTGKAAVGKFAMRNSEHLALVLARDDVLLLQTLRWPDELNSPAEAAPRGNVKITDSELRLADTLIEALGEADLEEYHDEYAQAVEALVAAKLEGAEPPTARREGGGQVVDLMAALQASVDQARGGERGGGRGRGEGGDGGEGDEAYGGDAEEEESADATVHELKSSGRKKAPAKKAPAKKRGGGASEGAKTSGSKAAASKKTAAKKSAAKKAPAKKAAPRRRTG